MKTQEIIEFILNEHSQITIEGHYAVRALFTYAEGKTLDETFKNWYIKFQKNMKNKEFRWMHGFDGNMFKTNRNIPQF